MPRKPRKRARSGDGSVFQRTTGPKAGKWIAKISYGERGKQRTVERVRDTESEALEALRRLRAESPAAIRSAEPPLYLEELMKQWLDRTRPRVRPKTWVTYELVVRRHVIPHLGAMRVDRIRPRDVDDMLAQLERAGVSPRVRELAYMRLRSALESAVGSMIVTNPVKALHKPRVERKTMRVWSQEQSRAFLEFVVGDRFAELYRLALSVGMRRGELLALQWRDVDIKHARIHVQHTLSDDGELAEAKTAGSRRTIELPTRAARALAERKAAQLAAGRRSVPWVFADGEGEATKPRLLDRVFGETIGRLNAQRADRDEEPLPKIRFHDLRHTCATLRLMAGDHPKVVSEMLGHASITITLDTYSHALPSMQRDAADRFDAIL